MTREEAINLLMSANVWTDEERTAWETLVPELAESEDERIRKWIVKFLVEQYPECWKDKKNKMLAYLEKQKEQNSAEWKATLNGEPIPTENHSVDISSQEWSGEDNICWDEAFACVTRAKKTAKNEEELQSAVTAEKWLKEIQFKYYVHPVKPEWSEEDIKKIRSEEYTKGFNDAAFGGKLKEWSVEDEDRIRQIERIAQQAGCTQKLQEEIHNWLKSLRPSWKPSEQEKGALRTAISILTEERSFPKAAAHLQAILDAFNGKEARKEWKPSEEQMEALSWLVEYVAPSEKYIILIKNLYEQLKKL